MKKAIATILSILFTTTLIAGCTPAAPSTTAAGTTAGTTTAGATTTAGTTTPAGTTAGNKLVLKLGHDHTTTSPIHASALKFADLVSTGSNGAITVEIYPAQSLGSSREMIESLQIGTLEAVLLPTAKFGGFDQRLNLADMPFLAETEDKFLALMNGEIGKEAMSGLPKIGIQGLAYYAEGFKAITNNVRPITKPEDLKGLKIRTMEAPIIMAMFKAWGANAVPVDFTEVYNSLQQKVVDGQENPFLSIHDMKFYEVQKYMTIADHAYLSYFMAASTKFMDKLTAEQKELIQKASLDASAFCLAEMKKANDGYLKTIKDFGVEVYNLTAEEKAAFKTASEPVYAEFRDIIGGDLLDRARAN